MKWWICCCATRNLKSVVTKANTTQTVLSSGLLICATPTLRLMSCLVSYVR
ncbi:Uncharacterised protein [Vibrio cholerae]|nr:Uncharacterised protein [Vibrio cholerae]